MPKPRAITVVLSPSSTHFNQMTGLKQDLTRPRATRARPSTGAFAELSAQPLGDRTKVPNRAARKQQVPEPLGTGTFEINTPWETEWPVLSASEKRQSAANTSARSSSPFSSAAVCRTFS